MFRGFRSDSVALSHVWWIFWPEVISSLMGACESQQQLHPRYLTLKITTMDICEVPILTLTLTLTLTLVFNNNLTVTPNTDTNLLP